MSDYGGTDENSCSRCIRNSPVASLIGFILVLIGAGTFGGATIFARRYLVTAVNEPELFPCLDYGIYALIGALGLFSLLAYFLCAISSGKNARHCFESSRKAACGRCCNMTLLISLVLAILIWSAILCLMAYALVSIRLLFYRQNGPTRMLLSQVKQPSYSGMDTFATGQFRSGDTRLRLRRRQSSPMDQLPNEYIGNDISWPELVDTRLVESNNLDAAEDPFGSQPMDSRNSLGGHSDWINSRNRSDNDEAIALTGPVKKTLKTLAAPLWQDLSTIEALFHRCDENAIDLSYYGLYDSKGLPIRLLRKDMETALRPVFLCVCIATAGIFLILLGYVQIILCTTMNYARLQEKRYYEISDAGEEGVALNQ